MAIDSSPSVNVVSKPSVGSGLSGLNLTGVGSVVGAVLNPFLQWQQNRYNQRLMEQQNQWNLEQWQRETAYNSPSAQMQRLAAAGINPALAFSQGQLVNEAAASPQMAASQGTAPQVDVSGLVSAGLAGANQEYLQSLARKNNMEATAIETKLPEEVVNLQKRNQELDQAIENMRVQVEEMRSHISQMDEDARLKFAQRADITFQQQMASEQFKLKCEEVHANIQKLVSEKQLNESLRDLNKRRLYEDIQSWSYRLAGFDLENERIRAVTGLTVAQTRVAEKDAALLGLDFNEKSLTTVGSSMLMRWATGDSKFAQFASQAIIGIIGAEQWLLNPLKGVISLHN